MMTLQGVGGLGRGVRAVRVLLSVNSGWVSLLAALWVAFSSLPCWSLLATSLGSASFVVIDGPVRIGCHSLPRLLMISMATALWGKGAVHSLWLRVTALQIGAQLPLLPTRDCLHQPLSPTKHRGPISSFALLPMCAKANNPAAHEMLRPSPLQATRICAFPAHPQPPDPLPPASSPHKPPVMAAFPRRLLLALQLAWLAWAAAAERPAHWCAVPPPAATNAAHLPTTHDSTVTMSTTSVALHAGALRVSWALQRQRGTGAVSAENASVGALARFAASDSGSLWWGPDAIPFHPDTATTALWRAFMAQRSAAADGAAASSPPPGAVDVLFLGALQWPTAPTAASCNDSVLPLPAVQVWTASASSQAWAPASQWQPVTAVSRASCNDTHDSIHFQAALRQAAVPGLVASSPSTSLAWLGNRSAPVQLPAAPVLPPETVPRCAAAAADRVVAVEAGWEHACAVLGSGAATCWGANTAGQLGSGLAGPPVFAPRAARVAFANGTLLAPITSLAVGAFHTCAVRYGAVYCWGQGSNGRLGSGSTASSAFPLPVHLAGTATAVTAGGDHSCAVMFDDSLSCWGGNAQGQLGLGHSSAVGDDEIPGGVRVDVGGRIAAVAAGTFLTCALRHNGTVVCWGWNTFGDLGYGHTSNVGASAPPGSLTVDLGGRTAVQLTAARNSPCALFLDGTSACWGRNVDSDGRFYAGLAGIGAVGTIGDDEVPGSVATPLGGRPIAEVRGGWYHACATSNAGHAVCWGSSLFGRTGRGSVATFGDDEVPGAGRLDTGGDPVLTIAGGGRFSCALLASGHVQCFGDNSKGQLGADVSDLETMAPRATVQVAISTSPLAAACSKCDLDADGVLHSCWAPPPRPVVLALAAGGQFTCSLLRRHGEGTPSAACWGRNDQGVGQLGNGISLPTGDTRPPAESRVDLGPGHPVGIVAGNAHACVLLQDHTVACWGDNTFGQVGQDTVALQPTLAPIAEYIPESRRVALPLATAVGVGPRHSCLVTTAGAVRCWGDTRSGQVGDQSAALAALSHDHVPYIGGTAAAPPAHAAPVNVLHGDVAVAVDAGADHSCALLQSGAVACWGLARDGRLGLPLPATCDRDELPRHAGDSECLRRNATEAVDLGGATATALCSGDAFSCALQSDGAVACWGSDGSAATALGVGPVGGAVNLEAPPGAATNRRVDLGGRLVTALACGREHVCGIVAPHSAVVCWGRGTSGRLGYGDEADVGATEVVGTHVVPLPAAYTVASLTAGNAHTCAVTTSADALCWGAGGGGRLGYGDTGSRGTAAAPLQLSARPVPLDNDGSVLHIGASVTGSPHGHPPFRAVHPQFLLFEGAMEASRPHVWHSAQCIEGCDTAALAALPPWAADALPRGAPLALTAAGLPTPPVASGRACTQVGLPLRHVAVWSDACTWPTATALLNVTRVFTAESSGQPSLSPDGGQSLFLDGSFWALALFDTGANAVLVGDQPCTQLRISADGGQLSCVYPPLSAPDSAAARTVRLLHSIPGQADVMLLEAVQFAPPQLLAVVPADDLPQAGGRIRLEGFAFGVPRNCSACAAGQGLAPGAVTVLVGGLPCVDAQHLSSTAIQCDAPPGVGVATVQLSVAARPATGTRSVAYRRIAVTAVTPAHVLVPAASPSLMTLTVTGSGLGGTIALPTLHFGTVPCVPLHQGSTTVNCTLDVAAFGAVPPAAVDITATLPGSSHTAILQDALRVYGQPLLRTAEPGVLPQAGGAVTLFGSRFGPPSAAAAQVTVTLANTPCVVLSVGQDNVTCMAAPGMGNTHPVRLLRSGWTVALVASQAPVYEAPRLHGAVPALLQAPATMHEVLALRLQGGRLAPDGQMPSGTLHLAGVPCRVSVANSSHAVCSGLNASAIPPGTWRLQGSIGGADVVSTALVTRAPSPTVVSVQPAAVTAAGGVTITLLGAGFAHSAATPAPAVEVGGLPCLAVQVLADTRLSCMVPPGSGSAPVTVTTAAGVTSAAGAAASVAFIQPGVFVVSPAVLQVAPLDGAPQLVNLTVTGASLPSGAAAAATTLRLGGMDCVAAGGAVQVDPSGDRVRCRGADLRAMLPVAAGTAGSEVQLETGDGLHAATGAGTFAVLGQPVASALSPSRAQPLSTVTLEGANLGASAADLLSVAVGSAAQPATWVSPKVITFTAPSAAAGAVPLDVVVHFAVGWSTAALQLTLDLPAPAPSAAPTGVCARRIPVQGAEADMRVTWHWPAGQVAVVAWRLHVMEMISSGQLRNRSMLVTAASVQVGDAAVAVETSTCSAPEARYPRIAAVFGEPRHSLTAEVAPTEVHSTTVVGFGSGAAWVSVVAVSDTAREDATSGPASPTAGPVWDACNLDEFLSTHLLHGLQPVGAAPQGSTLEAAAAVLCQPCPAGAACGGRGWAALTAAPGHYQVPWSSNALTFLPCDNADACPGANRNNASAHDANKVATSCAPGYRGLLCAQCAVGHSKASSTRGGGVTCARCRDRGSMYAIAITAVLCMMLYLVYLAHSTMTAELPKVTDTSPPRREPEKVEHTVVRLLMDHYQQVAMAASFPLEWPAAIDGLLQTLSVLTSAGDTVTAPECLGWDEGNPVQASAVQHLILPFFLWAIAAAGLFTAWVAATGRCERCKAIRRQTRSCTPSASNRAGQKTSKGNTVQNVNPLQLKLPVRLAGSSATNSGVAVPPSGAAAAAAAPQAQTPPKPASTTPATHDTAWYWQALVVFGTQTLITLHMPLTNAVLRLLACRSVHGRMFLTADLSIACGGEEHTSMYVLGICSLVILSFGIPIVLTGMLCSNWLFGRLNDSTVLRVWGFLYTPFREGAFLWQCAIILFKVVFVTVLVFSEPFGLAAQIGVVAGVLVLFMAWQLWYNPYAVPEVQAVANWSLLVVIITLLSGLILIPVAPPAYVSNALKEFVTVVIFAGNLAFLAVVAVMGIKSASSRTNGKTASGTCQAAMNTAMANTTAGWDCASGRCRSMCEELQRAPAQVPPAQAPTAAPAAQ